MHHLGHFLHAVGLHEHAHTGFMALIGNPAVSGILGAAALLGPGRSLLVDGATSLFRSVHALHGRSTNTFASVLLHD